jgi:PAS domain S-box-containing protein
MPFMNGNQGSGERWRDTLWLVIGMLFSGVLLLAADWEANRREQLRMDDFRGDVVDLARISESVIVGKFLEYDHTLLVLRAAYAGNPKDFSQTVALLRKGPLKDPTIFVVVVDRDGYLAYTDAPHVKPHLFLGDSANFRSFAGDDKDHFYVNTPIFGRVTQRYILPLARPIYDQQGRFSGLVALSVTQESLAQLEPGQQLLGDTVFTVVNYGGEVVSRSRDLAGIQGSKIPPDLLAKLHLGEEGNFTSTAADGIERVIAFRHIFHGATPLIIYVESSAQEVLRDLARQRSVLRWSAGFSSLIIMALIAIYLRGKKISSRLIDVLRRRNEQEYAALTKTSIDGVWVTDTSGRILDTNATFCAMLGYSREDILHLNLVDIEGPGTVERVADHFRHAMDVGSDRFQSQLRHQDGTIVDVEISVQFVRELDKRFFVFVRDLTRQKLAEDERNRLQLQLQQAQKIESIGHLAGGIAHDFNNMLGVILGHADLALMKADPSNPFVPNLEEIRKAAEKSADLTRQLLTFARKQTIAPKVLDLNETVAGMLSLLQRLIGENIHLSWQPATDLWPVKVDPSQFDQILTNLCLNARDAITGAGTITIQTDNSSLDETDRGLHSEIVPGDYVRLTVSDDGSGMDKETLEHIFEPFFTTKEVGSGTGLGLASVLGAVKQHNGYVYAQSEPGHGTTVNVFLPRVETSVAAVPEPTEKPHRGGTETVLLVEDDKMLLRLLKSMLEKSGYRVLAAGTPEIAESLSREHPGPIHLLISDLVMPVMNGRELSEILQPLRPEMKVLFMSGYSADIISSQGVIHKGIHLLSKPVSFETLTKAVRSILDAS